MSDSLPMLIITTALLCIATTALAINSFRKTVRGPDRTYMDPLSGPTRVVWPLVLFVSYYFGRWLTVEYLEKIQRKLVHAGLNYNMGAEQFVSLRVVTAALFAAAAASALSMLDIFSLFWLMLAASFGGMVPLLKLKEARRKRERSIVKTLPTYLDFITMAVEAGLSLPGALIQATANGPEGLFRLELEKVNRDIKAGAGRVEALESMANRLEMREVTSVVSAIAQAERSGGSVGATLRVQAEQQRIDRFQRAEKQAMEAPVKLIFPLVAFIFPTTFIVLGFPIVMKLLHDV